MNSNRIEIVEMARYLADGEHFFLEYNDADVFISPHLHRFIEIELITGGSFLMLLDEESFRYAMDHGLLEELPEKLQNASGAKEGHGILLSSLPIYNTDGFHELASLSYLCLRKAPDDGIENYGRTQNDYESAKKLFETLTKKQENE